MKVNDFSRRIHQLTLVSPNFLSAPIVMIITGVGAIFLTVSGFISLRTKQFSFNIVTSILGIIVLLCLIVSITFSFLLLSNIDNDINKVNVDEELRRASQDSSLMSVWDSLQIRLRTLH